MARMNDLPHASCEVCVFYHLYITVQQYTKISQFAKCFGITINEVHEFLNLGDTFKISRLIKAIDNYYLMDTLKNI